VEGAKETVRARRSHLRWPPVYLLTHGLSVRPSRLRSTDRASDAQTGIVTRAIFGPLLANQLAQPVCQRVCQSSIWRCSQCHGFCMTAHDTRAATCFATSLGKSWQLCPRALRWAYCFGGSVGKRIMRTAGQPPLLSSPKGIVLRLCSGERLRPWSSLESAFRGCAAGCSRGAQDPRATRGVF
jgi:hypothetical protein